MFFSTNFFFQGSTISVMGGVRPNVEFSPFFFLTGFLYTDYTDLDRIGLQLSCWLLVSCLDTIHLYLHDTVHFGTGKDRKATPRPDGVLSIYNHLILDSPWSQPSSARHQQYIISPPRPHEKTKSRKFSTYSIMPLCL